MTFRSRPAAVGGAAIGVVVLALAAVRTGWFGAADPSGCPRTLSRSAPATLDDASRLIADCAVPEDQARLRGAPFPNVMSHRRQELPPAAWLAPGTPLARQLAGLGFEHADDMSLALLSAAWHRARRLPFDAKPLAECLRAWNRTMRLWIDSVPPGSQVPTPEFGCATSEEIDKSRHLWPKE